MDDKQKQYLKDRFTQLPKPVQDAITSADVQKHLRELGQQNKLHLDQLEILENEVLMALFGLTSADDLQANLQKELKLDDAAARPLAEEVSRIVFVPIREALERELAKSTPPASAGPASPPPTNLPTAPALPAVVPATPPPPVSAEKVVRTPPPEAYKGGEASAARKDVASDPYRELPK